MDDALYGDLIYVFAFCLGGLAFAFGPFVNYAFATVSSFTGTILDNTNNVNTTGQLYTLKYGTWPIIQVIAPDQVVPAGALPTQLDLGGLSPGFQFSAFF